MEPAIYALISVVIVSLASFSGAFILVTHKTFLSKTLNYLLAFATGAILGNVFLNLMPEVAEEFGFGLDISLYILLGILVSFIIEKVVHYKHCMNEKKHLHPGPHKSLSSKASSYLILIGDGIHNFIDGIVIAATYLVSVPLGIATSISILFHEIPQEIGDIGVLIHGGMTRKKALFFNFMSALTAVVGAIIVISLGEVEIIEKVLLPFAIGNLIYIAATDLIPALHHETQLKKSVIQFVWIVLGLAVMFALKVYLPGH